jgi:hypothetical protein
MGKEKGKKGWRKGVKEEESRRNEEKGKEGKVGGTDEGKEGRIGWGRESRGGKSD